MSLFKSAKGIDYTKLEELLRQQKWKEADKETYVCMITAVGKKDGDFFEKKDIDNFPCEDLRTIDQLWGQYSNGRFGFSVQKKIWLEVGGKVDYNTEKKLAERLGWWRRVGLEVERWEEVSSLRFDLSAPPGHLPGVGFMEVRDEEWRVGLGMVWMELSEYEDLVNSGVEWVPGDVSRWREWVNVPEVGSSLAQRTVTCEI